MKAEPHTPVRIYLLLGISLVFYPTFGSCLDGISHSSKVGRYIMGSYYEKYESFIDAHFDGFLSQDLPVNICEVLPCDLNTALSLSIRSRINGEGSHRQLSSTIKFNIKKSMSQVPIQHCKFIIIERLPSGVFADPFELEHLLHRAVFSDVAVFGDTNLELPSVLSNISVVEVHKDIGPNILSHNKNLLDFTVDLPLHSRYPRLDESGYVQVRLKAPDLFLQCSIQEKPHNRSCLFKLESDDAEADLTWSIPAGKRSDAGIVRAVTFVSALLSVLCIVFFTQIRQLKVMKQC
ncbi:phosphatidylinositol-glycan biosynthesis class X protein isoform X1 [Benincasa hispida]|uniref:phosphatidylinositol-glycan biosynthesis class X protein isoform X1 n=2 Tax=Benincasa hispida TaxID=102211 RepID=UPI00190171F3|nr:phosphatidylinositol-glycan biosynthesis class X protein isoform X1 [Benincasa hispida]XP_038881269.1 phosphatidylinositol-glycan biosynthesis class X protein isoform X1 [Benincasa hispida]XP_038881270.1 phosphatidylinositol-glycan biosynthesis class X protein isoform X1 [Benincasa hispida]